MAGVILCAVAQVKDLCGSGRRFGYSIAIERLERVVARKQQIVGATYRSETAALREGASDGFQACPQVTTRLGVGRRNAKAHASRYEAVLSP